MSRAGSGFGRLVNNLGGSQVEANGHAPSYAAVAAAGPTPRSASGQLASPGSAVSRYVGFRGYRGKVAFHGP